MLRLIVLFPLAVLSLGACEGKEELGTELANASMSPVLWEPLDSNSVIDPNGPPPTTCALRLSRPPDRHGVPDPAPAGNPDEHGLRVAAGRS